MQQNRFEQWENKLKHFEEHKRFSRFLLLLSFLLAAAAFLMTLAALNILGYGNDTILRGDLYSQYVCFIRQFLRCLNGEGSFWYSFSTYIGSPSILTYAYYTLNPFNLLYLIDSVSVPAMTMFIITIKLALASLTFQLFVQKVLKQRHLYTIIFCLGYALSGYAVTQSHNIMWLDVLYLFPLMMILVQRLVDTGRSLLLIPALVYLFLTNFYMAYIAGVFTAIVFFAYSFYRLEPGNAASRKKMLQNTFRFAGCGILSAAICAAVLLPTALFLYGNLAEDNFDFRPLAAAVHDMVNAMFIGQMQALDTQVPYLYCGLPVLALLPFYFINKKISFKEKLFAGILSAYLVLSMLWLPLYKFMHAFDYPNYYGYRFAFMLIFIMCVLACREAPYLKEIPAKTFGLYFLGLFIFYSLMMQLQSQTFPRHHTGTPEESLINALFLLLWFLAVLLFHKKPSLRRVTSALMILLICAELVVNGKLCVSKVEHGAISENFFIQWYHSIGEQVDGILAEDDDFYRIAMNNTSNYNTAAFFGYPGLTTFSSSDNYPLRRALSHLGLATSNRAIQECGSTDLMDMLLAVKYEVTAIEEDDLEDPRQFTATDYISAIRTDKEYYLPVAYMVTPMIENYESTSDPFYNQMALLYDMTGNLYQAYEPIQWDDLHVTYDNMAIAYNDSSIEFYPLSDSYGGGHIYISAQPREGYQFLIYFARKVPMANDASARIISVRQGTEAAPTIAYAAIARAVPNTEIDGVIYDNITLEFSNGYREDYCDAIYTYHLNESLLPVIRDDLMTGAMQVTEHGEDRIVGTVTSTPERPVLFTTIPYDKGWKATVDGEPAATYPVLEDAFLALVLTPGTHNVELTYEAPGSTEGMMISAVALIVLLLVLLISRRSPAGKTGKDNVGDADRNTKQSRKEGASADE